LEPLWLRGGKPPSHEEIRDWVERFQRLPIKEKNLAMEENEGLAEIMGARVTSGNLLVNALAAENNGDFDQGKHTFLTILEPLRKRLAKEYEVKTAVEFMLLDTIVLSYYQYIRAANLLHAYTAFGKSLNYETLVRYAQSYLDRANQIFLRNLTALRDMKAAPMVVKIEQAGQVNVGEKQVNVAGGVTAGGAKPAGAVVNGAATALPEKNPASEGQAGPLRDSGQVA
jgi:hypothetical protein